jgi:hypothetical protein
VTGTNDGSRVLDASAHLLSRALVEPISFRELVYKAFSYFKREADICFYIPAPPAFVRVGQYRNQNLFPERGTFILNIISI